LTRLVIDCLVGPVAPELDCECAISSNNFYYQRLLISLILAWSSTFRLFLTCQVFPENYCWLKTIITNTSLIRSLRFQKDIVSFIEFYFSTLLLFHFEVGIKSSPGHSNFLFLFLTILDLLVIVKQFTRRGLVELLHD